MRGTFHTWFINFEFIVRGRMLQYMNGPRMMLAKLDLQEGKISKQQFVMETAQALKLVKFATNCFDEYIA